MGGVGGAILLKVILGSLGVVGAVLGSLENLGRGPWEVLGGGPIFGPFLK